MRVADGVEMLEVTQDIMGRTSTICPALLWDSQDVILVDAGFPGQLALFQQAMAKAGVPLQKLTKVLITHQDIDHIGSLADIVAAAGHPVEVLCSEGEKPYIQGEKTPIKMTPEAIEKFTAGMPPEVREERMKSVKARLANLPKARVDRTFKHGDELPLCGGIVVIDTPGHTPWHVSLYHTPSRTLISGDALTAAEGVLNPPSPGATLDVPLALKSLKTLAPFDIANVIAYHGGLVRTNIRQRISELAG